MGFIAEKVYGKTLPLSLGDPSDCNFAIPELQDEQYDSYEEVKYYKNSKLASKAIVINDAESTTQKEKELVILELFKDSCYNLTFID